MRRRRVRRRLVRTLAVALAAAGLTGGPAAAQSDVPLAVDGIDTAAHPQLSLVFTAPRELVGRELTSDDLTVVEGGVIVPASITRLPNDGLEVVLVVDTSGSMQGDAIVAARQAAVEFVRAMPAEALIGVVGFGDRAEVGARLGTPRDEVVAAIEALEPRGETALYDSVVTTAGQLASGGGEARRFVVLLSDGGDTASVASLEDAAAALSGAGAGFSAIALATSESDLGALGQLAQAADGRVVAASDPSEIAGVYDAIASELVNQYRIDYVSQAGGSTSVDVVLEADGVRARWTDSVELPALPAAPPEPIAPSEYVAPQPGLLADERLLLVGAVPLALAMAMAGWLLASSRRVKLPPIIGGANGRAAASAVLSGMAERATEAAERMLASGERTGRLNAALERAGLAVRPGEFMVLVGSVAMAAAVFGTVMGGVGVGIVMASVAVAGSWLVVGRLQRRRRERMADQLGDTLQLLSGSLRSGHGLVQALDQVTREAESPTAEEFHRVIVEARLGRDLTEALEALAERAGNEDLEWVVQAIRIHREVGGDLAEILDRVGETIRDRNRVRGQIRSLTAEGRMSALILLALPFLVGGWMWISNRPYVSELFVRPSGRAVLAVGAVLMTTGALILRRLVRPDF